MRRIFILVVSAIVVTGLSKCSQSNEPTQPEYKDPREMTWTADTLKVEEDWVIQVLPEDMLVIAPDNIWLSAWVGHAQMWHYNGENWEMKQDIGGAINSIVLRDENDIWAGGRTGDFFFFANYTGVSWETYTMLSTIELYDSYSAKRMPGAILDMCVDTENNLWACGRNGTIFKYDGLTWEVDTIKIDNYPIDKYFLQSIEYYNGRVHTLATLSDYEMMKETYFYITGDINNWCITDSIVINGPYNEIKWGRTGLFRSSYGSLYSYGSKGTWELINDYWINLFEITSKIMTFYSAGSNYLIAAGGGQKFIFFDGNRWNEINNLLNIDDTYFNFTVCWTNGQEIFIGGHTFEGRPQRGIIWHGK